MIDYYRVLRIEYRVNPGWINPSSYKMSNNSVIRYISYDMRNTTYILNYIFFTRYAIRDTQYEKKRGD